MGSKEIARERILHLVDLIYDSYRDIYFVSRALDHKSVEVTKRYLALDIQEDLEETRAVSPMDKAFRQTGIKVNRNRAYL